MPYNISFNMRKIYFIIGLALCACGSKQEGQQADKGSVQKLQAPSNQLKMPVVHPVDEGAAGLSFESSSDTTSPNVIKLEPGKPLDFSKILGGGTRKSVEDIITERYDEIRDKAYNGDSLFQYYMGVCYENGWGTEKIPSEAYEWYMKAARKGEAKASNALGNLFRTGVGVDANMSSAVYWYKKAAEAGDEQAMLNYGNCFYYGAGIQRDIRQAMAWWQKAADAGNGYAMSQLGDMYFSGKEVNRDLKKAIAYWEKAVGKNVANAQYRLALCYYTGEGVSQDTVYTELLMRKASMGGCEEAAAFLEKR